MVKFRRTKLKKRYAKFGYVEFENISSVYSCLRIVNDLKILDKALVVKAKDQVGKLHDEWQKVKY